MNPRTPLLAALLGLFALAGAALAQTPSQVPDRHGCPLLTAAQVAALKKIESEEAHNEALMRQGKAPAVDFLSAGVHAQCKRDPSLIVCTGGAPVSGAGLLTLAQVKAADSWLRARFQYQYDEIVYIGQPDNDDVWADKVVCGDCEDYALTLARLLNERGAAGASMVLVPWIPVPFAGHMTLLVHTADAGDVEVGVSAFEAPHPMNWHDGKRLGVIPLDGTQDAVFRVPARGDCYTAKWGNPRGACDGIVHHRRRPLPHPHKRG